MTGIYEFIIGLFIIIGSLLSLIATIGAIRLPDVYTRNHAIAKATTLGVMMILLGALIYFMVFESHFNSRLLLAILFIFMTAPISGHLIGRAAYHSGVKMAESSVTDDLGRDLQKKEKSKSRNL
ncbi:monovalent cation/H(+) antiporter subunit G [Bacillus sp. B15-48]|uniref:monovalent cation/H(+) antiporter subunit G n=1 Tax=Bacillus sp. B15-48 TaxID=1548601 RepID=UPI00193F4EFB|nr:Na+/H+ antiporter subunit G [Bacillus sp. B15-48]